MGPNQRFKDELDTLIDDQLLPAEEDREDRRDPPAVRPEPAEWSP
ncbi:hypothetical protein OG292_16705 [Streptomyces sp. NBC_01511]